MATLSGLSQAVRPAKKRTPEQTELLSQKPPDLVEEIHETILLDQQIQDTPFHRASGIGGCRRQEYYNFLRYRRESQKYYPKLQLILDNGHGVHDHVVGKWLQKSYNLFVAAEVHIWVPKLQIHSHADFVCTRRSDNYQWVVEAKSINKEGFNKLTKAKDDHVWQANIYTGLLGLEWFTVLYVNKDNQLMRQFHYRFNRGMFKEAEAWCDEVQAFVDKKKLPLFRSSECNEEFCRFVKQCKKDRLGKAMVRQ